ncbi:hypothetical protein CEW87_03515 [Parazoarcus communis]|uniref:Uncharacterized protein n=1 Tax=Parazoarcus communis TaxID=41977 RepID=A0A2U8GZZ0_9RHOO|nr:hypothetical protein CEW87_03515 [Parazoarcus communis]
MSWRPGPLVVEGPADCVPAFGPLFCADLDVFSATGGEKLRACLCGTGPLAQSPLVLIEGVTEAAGRGSPDHADTFRITVVRERS